MNIEEYGAWDKEHSADYKHKEPEDSLHNWLVADASEAQWSEGALGGVGDGTSAEAVHGYTHDQEA